MKSRARTVANVARLVDRGVAPLNEPPRRERYGQASGLIELRRAESAALAEAARRALRAPGH